MKILFLGPNNKSQKKICFFLNKSGDKVFNCNKEISLSEMKINNYDYLISYGYKYIMKKDLLKFFNNKIINLHISLLPWNRGADPNLWSFLESTPKGVSIHLVDEGIDAGPLLVTKKINHNQEDTLRTSYDNLTKAIESLFLENWEKIKLKKIKPIKQSKGGSFHKLNDKKIYENLLINGWDTKISQIEGKANNN